MKAIHTTTSRRHFCFCCAGAGFLASGVALTPRETFAQARDIVALVTDISAASPINIYELRNGIYALQGSGGNIAVQTGHDGKLMVDAGLAASRPQLLTALDSLSDQPIKHLINTHWHFDHADGNTWLNQMGATIYAQENTRKYLASTVRVADWNHSFSPLPDAGVPTRLFSEKLRLNLNDATMDLQHYGSAHTDGDAAVRFRDADILHTGDTYWNGFFPFIDYSTGGSLDGTIAASDYNLSITTDQTIIIPGHGHPVSNRRELLAFRNMLLDVRAKIGALKQNGQAIAQIISARPTAPYDEKWGQFVVSPETFTRLVYEGV